MGKYVVEIVARYEIETDDIDEVILNYAVPVPCVFEYCESIVGEPEFLSGTFSFEEEKSND
jgi:hypothetical protein